MPVKIGSARHDERGRARGGKAGDNTRHEVETQNWYNRWINPWRVIRCKDPSKRPLIAKAMRAACANNLIGYDQGQRDTLYAAAQAVGFDPGKVTASVETDCSALVRVCCAFAGIKASNFRTPNEAACLKATGYFDVLSDSKYIHRSDYLLEGDILCTARQGHTVVVLSNGAKATVTLPTASKGQILANDVNVRTGPGVGYSVLGVVGQGDMLDLSGESSGNWTGVVYKGTKAWVYGRYIKAVAKG